ncbi:S53 family peptidase [Conexibacter sp. DBS9H8]|uniref:S53 family peptidase n=1 Tax=Conexibacter sp. DBS9H8 TaxID=2937801 RepID=UPI00200F14FE|nr:S53 family peptidase [Conexibacter sp. DBS9H8]
MARLQKGFISGVIAAVIIIGAQIALAAPSARRADALTALGGRPGLATVSPGGLLNGPTLGRARVVLASAPTALIRSAHSLGALPATTRLKVILPLLLPNQAALTRFVSSEYDSHSPDYHHFLAPAAFTARFGAPVAEVDAVTRALARLGLGGAAAPANRLYVSVTAPVSRLSAVFHSPIDAFAAAHPLGLLGLTRFFANTRDLTVPASLASLVTGVIGLSNADAPQPNLAVVHLSPAQRRRYAAAQTAALARARTLARVRTLAQTRIRSRVGGVSLPGSPAVPVGQAATPVGVGGGATPCASAVAGGGYTAPQLAAGYNLNGLYSAGYHGEGMSMALVEFDDFHDSNVSEVESCYGLSTPVTRRLVDGGVGGPPAAGEIEDMADITTVLEMLPKLAHLYVYEAPADGGLGTPTDEGDAELDLYNAFVTDDLAPVISSSWGNCEQFNSAAYSALLGDITEEAAAQGQQIFDAAGDSGAVDCRGYPNPIASSISVEAEASQPWVTGVGGTDLSQESTVPNSGIHHELPWNDNGAGGGGQSSIWSMPSWQRNYLAATGDKPAGLGGNCNSNVVVGGVQYCRMVPDIALNADEDAGGAVSGSPSPPDFSTEGDVGSVGYSIYCATPNCGLLSVLSGQPLPSPPAGAGGWEPVGGTSLATPLAASAALLWDQEAEADGLSGGLGFLNPSLYQVAANPTEYANDFFNITTGSNSDQYGGCTAPACNPQELYAAGKDYNMATGLGSIEATNLGADLIKNAATLDVTPDTEHMYGYTSDPQNPSQPGPVTTAPVAVTGGGAGASDSASSDAAWLKVAPSGSSPGSLRWYVDPAGLAPGTYTATITITDAAATAAGAAPATLTVTYTVTPPARMKVTPAALDFSEPAVTDTGAPTTASCGSTYWGDELLNDVNSVTGDGGTTTYNTPASSLNHVTITNTGAGGSQLHYLVDYVADTGAWLSTDLLDANGSTQTTPNQTTPSQPLVPTNGSLGSGASASVPFASTANGNALGGYPRMNQGTYGGLVQIVDLADPAATVTVPASTVLGNGTGTPTMQWGINGAGVSDAPIQVTAAPGAAASFDLVLSDRSGVCGYAYSLGVANQDGSEDPAATPTASWMTLSSPYLAAGTVAGTPATAPPASPTDTGSGNGDTPIDLSVPSTPGVYQAFLVVDSQTAQGDAAYGPASTGAGAPSIETGATTADALGAPNAPGTGDPMFIPVCLHVVSGAKTATATGTNAHCAISSPNPGGSGTSTVTVTTPSPTTTIVVRPPAHPACRPRRRLTYVQHPAFPVLERRAIIYLDGRRIRTVHAKQIFALSLLAPHRKRFTVRYVAYLDDGEVISHQISYNGCARPRQIFRVLHRADRRIRPRHGSHHPKRHPKRHRKRRGAGRRRGRH